MVFLEPKSTQQKNIAFPAWKKNIHKNVEFVLPRFFWIYSPTRDANHHRD